MVNSVFGVVGETNCNVDRDVSQWVLCIDLSISSRLCLLLF